MPKNIKKNMAPKPKAKSDVYKKLPYKEAPKLQMVKQNDVKSPFTLGSTRGKDNYSALTAKGLISPMHNETKRDKDYARKKKAAELVFTTRLKESGLSLDEFKKTEEGAKLATDVQTVASQAQGY